MVDLVTSDGGLAILAAIGIVATAFSIVRDTKAQRAQVVAVTEDVPIDYGRAA